MSGWQRSDYLEHVKRVPVTADTLAYFRALPWTNKWLQNPEYVPIKMTTRVAKNDTEDELMSKTLQNEATISRWLLLAQKHILKTKGDTDAPNNENEQVGPKMPDVVSFVELNTGLCGFRDTLHGGIACTIMDETLGLCLELHRHTRMRTADSGEAVTELYTANLNVSYRAPVHVPGVYMTTAWLTRREGRKWFVQGQLCDEKGQVCVDAEGVWVAARPKKL